jgi:cellobiose-specific phosphotransferase system component IIA
MMAENFLDRQNKRLELLHDLEQQLLRLNALEKEFGKKSQIDLERKELRLQMMRIIAWMGNARQDLDNS